MKVAAASGNLPLSSKGIFAKESRFKKIFDAKKDSLKEISKPKSAFIDANNFLQHAQNSHLKSQKLITKALSKDRLDLNNLIKIQYKIGKYFTEQNMSSKLLEVSISSLKSVTQMNV